MTPYPINAKRENINSSYIIEILSFIEAAMESSETIKAPTAVNTMLRINFLVSLFKLLFLQINKSRPRRELWFCLSGIDNARLPQ